MTEEYPVYAKLSPQKVLQLGGDCFGWDDYDQGKDNFDCGFATGEGCSMAGTEGCDLDCPYREELEKHPAYPNCDLLASDYSM